jgi:signal transduction histidine kinase
MDELATVARLIDATPAAERAQVIGTANVAFPQLDLAYLAVTPAAEKPTAPDGFAQAIERHLGPGFTVTQIAPSAGSSDRRLLVRLRDGAAVTARIAPPPHPPAIGGPVVLTVLFIAISVTFLALWAARVLTKPLRSFTAAAENFQPDGEIPPLPERGPAEIRAAARALNRMRARIKELVAGRTLMLAAVSHDLRTPITRLRLRSEFIEDGTLRTQMLDELNHMNLMVESCLIHLRGGNPREPATLVDLATAVQTICDDYADMGHAVGYRGPDHLVLTAHPEQLRRAIANLVDNAVRHGRDVTVRLAATASAIELEVEDDGPGIADAQKEAMQQPFVRGDAARRMNGTAGFGLGLSIARAAVEAHGGTLDLIDRRPSGLIARISLAREAARPAAAEPAAVE